MSDSTPGASTAGPPAAPALDGRHGEIIALIGSERAVSRIEIARALGIAPSTASLKVQELIDAGLIAEAGTSSPTGGRRARHLRIVPDAGCVVAVDLGANHARIAVMGLSGSILDVAEIPLSIAVGPTVVLPEVVGAALRMADASGVAAGVRGIGLALPGPVDVEVGTLTLPSRMPGWKEFPVRDWVADAFGLPTVVENDANLMAYGEHLARGDGDSVTVKAGSGIGAGIIVDGRIHRGATFAAGDITHVRIVAAGDRPCSCGNLGCLETLASGASLIRTLREQGVDVATTSDIVTLAQQAHPLATTAVRGAGAYLGQVLCAVTNFFNPSGIHLGGLLSTVEPFVAAVRSEIYQGSHPLVTQHLVIDRTITDRNAAVLGAGRVALEATIQRKGRAPDA
jgi:predicted NBD/HSP70 family sugar kinase